MNRWTNKALALLLALLLMALPVLSLAEEEVDAPAPGTMTQEMLMQALYSGRLITGTMTFDDMTLPEGLDEPKMQVAIAALKVLKVQYQLAKDEDAFYLAFNTLIQDVPIINGVAKIDATGITVQTNAIPNKALFVPTAFPAMLLQSLSNGNLYFAALEENEDAQVVLNLGFDYFAAVVGSWGPRLQTATGVLYQYDETGVEETEARDAADIVMTSKFMPEDVKALIRALADRFYDDEQAQQAFANLLAPQGVTREQIRAFADQLPLDIAALQYTQDPIEFDLAMSEGYNVGFDGTMGRLFDKFPFETGKLTYDRKTFAEGRNYHFVGKMELPENGSLDADLNIFQTFAKNDVVERETILKMDVLADEGKMAMTMKQVTVGTTTETTETVETTTEQTTTVTAEPTTETTETVETATERTTTVTAEPTTTTTNNMSKAVTVAERVGEVDFKAESDITTTQQGMTMHIKQSIASGEFKALMTDAPTVLDVTKLTAEDKAALDETLESAIMQISIRALAALPPEVQQMILER